MSHATVSVFRAAGVTAPAHHTVRPNGQKSSNSSTQGSVTSIGFAMSPRANASSMSA